MRPITFHSAVNACFPQQMAATIKRHRRSSRRITTLERQMLTLLYILSDLVKRDQFNASSVYLEDQEPSAAGILATLNVLSRACLFSRH